MSVLTLSDVIVVLEFVKWNVINNQCFYSFSHFYLQQGDYIFGSVCQLLVRDITKQVINRLHSLNAWNMMTVFGYFVAMEPYQIADSSNCEYEQFGGNEVPCWRSAPSTCSCHVSDSVIYLLLLVILQGVGSVSDLVSCLHKSSSAQQMQWQRCITDSIKPAVMETRNRMIFHQRMIDR